MIAKVAYGVFVRKGAEKPDIDSVQAFKRAYLNAGSIAIFDPAAAGHSNLPARIFEQLGISQEIKSKMKIVGAPKTNQAISKVSAAFLKLPAAMPKLVWP